ncbi:MAG TPA: hypothetical protein VN708_15200 [Terriglobales bacterium]|nr:hypothetical protein [Terriglobales bacterium]
MRAREVRALDGDPVSSQIHEIRRGVAGTVQVAGIFSEDPVVNIAVGGMGVEL